MSEFVTHDECNEMAAIMERKYATYLDDRSFYIVPLFEAENDVVLIEVILMNREESFYYPVAARVKPAAEDIKPYDAAMLLLDVIDSYFEEFLTSGESVYLPIEWSNMEYDAVNFQMKGQILNRKVDKMADEILAKGEVYTGKNTII